MLPKMVVWIVGIALIVGLGLVWVATNQQPPPSKPKTTKQATPAKEQASPSATPEVSRPATMPPEDVLPTDRNLANWLPGDDIVSIELVDVAVSEEDRWDWELRFKVHATYNSTHEGAHISAKVLPNIRYGYNNYGNFRTSPSGTTFQKRVFIDVRGSEVWSTAVVFTLWNRVGDESEYYVEKVYPLKRLWKNTTD